MPNGRLETRISWETGFQGQAIRAWPSHWREADTRASHAQRVRVARADNDASDDDDTARTATTDEPTTKERSSH